MTENVPTGGGPERLSESEGDSVVTTILNFDVNKTILLADLAKEEKIYSAVATILFDILLFDKQNLKTIFSDKKDDYEAYLKSPKEASMTVEDAIRFFVTCIGTFFISFNKDQILTADNFGSVEDQNNFGNEGLTIITLYKKLYEEVMRIYALETHMVQSFVNLDEQLQQTSSNVKICFRTFGFDFNEIQQHLKITTKTVEDFPIYRIFVGFHPSLNSEKGLKFTSFTSDKDPRMSGEPSLWKYLTTPMEKGPNSLELKCKGSKAIADFIKDPANGNRMIIQDDFPSWQIAKKTYLFGKMVFMESDVKQWFVDDNKGDPVIFPTIVGESVSINGKNYPKLLFETGGDEYFSNCVSYPNFLAFKPCLSTIVDPNYYTRLYDNFITNETGRMVQTYAKLPLEDAEDKIITALNKAQQINLKIQQKAVKQQYLATEEKRLPYIQGSMSYGGRTFKRKNRRNHKATHKKRTTRKSKKNNHRRRITRR